VRTANASYILTSSSGGVMVPNGWRCVQFVTIFAEPLSAQTEQRILGVLYQFGVMRACCSIWHRVTGEQLV